MPSERDDDFVRARKEAAALLHLDFENLSPADSLRCDLVATLRSVIDDEQAKVTRAVVPISLG